MANIKSAKKRILVIEKKTALNRSKKSEIKTLERKLIEAIEAGNLQEAKERFHKYESRMSRLGTTGLFHKNKSARKVSKLRLRLNKLA